MTYVGFGGTGHTVVVPVVGLDLNNHTVAVAERKQIMTEERVGETGHTVTVSGWNR